MVNILRYNLTEVTTVLKDRLKLLILSLGIKKIEFAERVGVSPSYVSMLLSGKKSSPSDRFYAAAAREFHVNTSWLRSGEGRMFSVSDPDISDVDAMLLEKYHLLPLSDRKLVDTIINAMLLISGDSCKP
jgi:transcriptional regulator with XRE-family HTH domain